MNRPFRTTRRIANLREGRNDWYRIKNAATPAEPSVLHIYDEIGFFGVNAQDLIADLAAAGGDLEVHMNCPGGDVFEGVAIYNALKQRKGTVSVVIDGLAASAASFIAQAASPGHLAIAKNASMMIHDAFGMGIGNAADMRQLAGLLDAQSDNIAGIYADRSGKPVDHWREQMRAETWYVGQEAVDAGLADAIQGGTQAADLAVAASFDLSIFTRRPAEVQAAAPAPQDPDGDPAPESDPVPAPPSAVPDVQNAEKYNTDDRKRMASSGQAMDDGSYPIADAEDLDNAIHAVGRGGADHDSIRAHIIKRADALGLSSKIPDNWNSDGSMKDQVRTGFLNLSDEEFANAIAALKEAQ